MIQANQDVVNFLSGTYSNPLPLAPQIPGANNMGNMGQNANIYNQPNGGFNQPDNLQLQMLQGLMRSSPNSNTNHSVGNGGWSTSYGEPNPAFKTMSALSPAAMNKTGLFAEGGQFAEMQPEFEQATLNAIKGAETNPQSKFMPAIGTAAINKTGAFGEGGKFASIQPQMAKAATTALTPKPVGRIGDSSHMRSFLTSQGVK